MKQDSAVKALRARPILSSETVRSKNGLTVGDSLN